MAKGFGELAKLRGIVYYRLSPHELRAFGGAWSHGVPNMIRRIREQVFRVCPPFIVAYLIYDWAEKEHVRLQRKNPKDYENDV